MTSDNLQPFKTVYLVDDDPDHRHATAQALELEGLCVELFESGQALLDQISNGVPGIVVSDVKLPGKNGIDVCRECSIIAPGLPVILISGQPDMQGVIRKAGVTVFAFFEKPLNINALITSIKSALQLRTNNIHIKQKLPGKFER